MTAVVGLGSNLGDRAAVLAEAVRRLAALAAPGSLRASHLYETRPWGVPGQPDFLNAVAVFDTGADPADLLAACQQIERDCGRSRAGEVRWGPRVLDLDLLDLDGQVRGEPDPILPHPRIAERAFVLVPLCEILPAWRHPLTGRTAAEMLAALDPDPGEVRLAGALPAGEEDSIARAARPVVPRH